MTIRKTASDWCPVKNDKQRYCFATAKLTMRRKTEIVAETYFGRWPETKGEWLEVALRCWENGAKQGRKEEQDKQLSKFITPASVQKNLREALIDLRRRIANLEAKRRES